MYFNKYCFYCSMLVISGSSKTNFVIFCRKLVVLHRVTRISCILAFGFIAIWKLNNLLPMQEITVEIVVFACFCCSRLKKELEVQNVKCALFMIRIIQVFLLVSMVFAIFIVEPNKRRDFINMLFFFRFSCLVFFFVYQNHCPSHKDQFNQGLFWLF